MALWEGLDLAHITIINEPEIIEVDTGANALMIPWQNIKTKSATDWNKHIKGIMKEFTDYDLIVGHLPVMTAVVGP